MACYSPIVEEFCDVPESYESGVGGNESAFKRLNLRSIQEIPLKYRGIFSETPYFNVLQSTVLDDALYTDKSIAVCAPTGSGKTMIFELAIVRMLIKCDAHSQSHKEQKIVYMAPIKALCAQRHQEWAVKFGSVGLHCTQLTGDSNNDDFTELQRANIIFTTPEKWDSMTRRWHINVALISQVRLFLVDEVHLLNDECRGATMEAVVSRMKTKRAYLSLKSGSTMSNNLRFVAVSATIPNVEDIAAWLSSGDSPAVHYSLGDELRPVKLNIVVNGYPCYTDSEFKFDITLNYKLKAVIDCYSTGKPTLVFCSTRKSVEQASARLMEGSRYVVSEIHYRYLSQIANSVRCHKLRDCIMSGIAYHHAGLDINDRQVVEKGFTSGHILVLLSTSTLAMGVNLPAHLVIVKSTSHYVKGVCEEYSQSEIMQMIGRAGRPQFDTTATAVIMTKQSNRRRYENLVSGAKNIESSLHKHLIEHLNAEIVLDTIPDMSFTVEWIKSTFLYIRVVRNPTHYGYPEGLPTADIERRLYELCSNNLDALSSEGLVVLKESHDDKYLQSTSAGRLMAQYCIGFDTMKSFINFQETLNAEKMITLIANCKEFNDITLRVNERTVLNKLNKSKTSATIRFPMEGRVKNTQMKVNCLLQAVLGSLPLQDFALQQDITKIFRTAIRISRCFVEYKFQTSNFTSLLNASKFVQSIKSKMWENSPYVCRQLPGIGPVLATSLVNSGIKSFDDVSNRNPRDIELIVSRNPPFGNHLVEAVKFLPKYNVTLEKLGCHYSAMKLRVNVCLENSLDLRQKRTVLGKHCCILLIGDSRENILLKQRISDSDLLSSKFTSDFQLKNYTNDIEVKVAYCSQEWVGLDVEYSWSPFTNSVLKPGSNGSVQTTNNASQQSSYFSSNDNSSCYTTPKNIPAKYACGTSRSYINSGSNKRKSNEKVRKVGTAPKTFSSQNVSNWMSKYAYEKRTNCFSPGQNFLNSSMPGSSSHINANSIPDDISSSAEQCLWNNKPDLSSDDQDADSAISMYLDSVNNCAGEEKECHGTSKRKLPSSPIDNPVRKRLSFQDSSAHETSNDSGLNCLPNFDMQWDDWSEHSNSGSGNEISSKHGNSSDLIVIDDDDDDKPCSSGLHSSYLKSTPDETPISYKASKLEKSNHPFVSHLPKHNVQFDLNERPMERTRSYERIQNTNSKVQKSSYSFESRSPKNTVPFNLNERPMKRSMSYESGILNKNPAREKSAYSFESHLAKHSVQVNSNRRPMSREGFHENGIQNRNDKIDKSGSHFESNPSKHTVQFNLNGNPFEKDRFNENGIQNRKSRVESYPHKNTVQFNLNDSPLMERTGSYPNEFQSKISTVHKSDYPFEPHCSKHTTQLNLNKRRMERTSFYENRIPSQEVNKRHQSRPHQFDIQSATGGLAIGGESAYQENDCPSTSFRDRNSGFKSVFSNPLNRSKGVFNSANTLCDKTNYFWNDSGRIKKPVQPIPTSFEMSSTEGSSSDAKYFQRAGPMTASHGSCEGKPVKVADKKDLDRAQKILFDILDSFDL